MALLKLLLLLMVYKTICVTCILRSDRSKGSRKAPGVSDRPHKAGRCMASMAQLQGKMTDMQQAMQKQYQRQRKYSGLALIIVSHVFVPALLMILLTLSIFSIAVQHAQAQEDNLLPSHEEARDMDSMEEDLPPTYEEAVDMARMEIED